MKINLFLIVLQFWIVSVAGFVTIQHQTYFMTGPLEKTSTICLRSTPGDDEVSINVLGTKMECCCSNVRDTGIGTGFYRNGYCSTGSQDIGRHTVCVKVTAEFLEFSKSVGNDLSTPFPDYMFPGLKDGDVWCLCAQRWAQAYQFGKAPKLYLRATHEKTLDYVDFKILREFALDGTEADEEKGVLDEKRDQLEKLFGKEETEESSEESSSEQE
mmetsp:Transcript_21292/g.43787  ORF Transcript_21292/g.43787 Transcript_21292/m.43787 type:complete len:214 (+) Transcript_21292:188-829(+)|eukprot:CAMPEP_0197263632 /NCGR_PEP_ID=MMETSP1432-20130617/1293_1 /TAXON_ID=44447 /ORGANISM="Pseudo-nitzschia delicatissima, Strain UNC1205" /LENGTH=213 /DNA_ID=CAMNT_0042728161 /DNA_START=133 /DNA_END=774 /DNA_ORIENTATION=+